MDEAHALALEHQDALTNRDVERVANRIRAAQHGIDELDGRSAGHGRGERDLANLVRQTFDALTEQHAETVGHSEARSAFPSRSMAGQLQREERVATGSLIDQSQVGPAQFNSQTLAKQALQGTRTERIWREPRDPLPRKRPLEIERHSRLRLLSQRHQDTDRLLTQPTHRHLKHRDRRRVQPLNIIERHQHRPRLTQHPENVNQRQPDRVRVGRLAVRFCQQERHLQCPSTGSSERRRHTIQHAGEQLGQARKGEHRLRLHTAPREHPAGPQLRILARDLPQNRLPDPRLAGDDESRRSRSQLCEKPPNRRKLRLAPNDGDGFHETGPF